MISRRLPVGAELVAGSEAGVHVRVWAPTWNRVRLVIEAPVRREIDLTRDDAGYFAGFAYGIGPGARYRFRLGDRDDLLADPASRFQPDGVFGPSEVIDPRDTRWSDAAWRGIEPHRHVVYELHVGTFTPLGTWAAAAAQLPCLADLGITTLELMPVGEFAGTRNWGYDGVFPFAPSRNYGTPADMRGFVDRAHQLGLAVILDVVYNHLGPSGNTFLEFSPGYKSAIHPNEWGAPLDFDGPDSAAVRELFVANAGYWIDEFHLDGLRLDATQAIIDHSESHVGAAITQRARDAGAGRTIFMVGENEPQNSRWLDPIDAGGCGLDALWNDDFHHAARIAATGTIDGYLRDYRGTPQELVSAVERGFLYQGQLYAWQKNPRGSPTRGRAPARFVHFLENHDQVANAGFGDRLITLTSPGRFRALTALLLLTPSIPLLFQGQEHGSRKPWRFFVDHDADLNAAVRAGRADGCKQFSALATPEAQAALPDPGALSTFSECVLDPDDRREDEPTLALHRDLLRLRRDDPAFTDQRPGAVRGAVIAAECLALRYSADDPAGDRLLLVNLGPTLRALSLSEPLIAPPADTGWTISWSSEHPCYGGRGTPPPFTRAGVAISGHSAALLVPDPGASLHVDDPPPSGDKLRPEP
jgi:maltooligosyltrehalose trehalohydrolase